MSKKVVIFGASILTDMICNDAKSHADFDIAAITVDGKYMNSNAYLGFPLIAFENVEKEYPPSDYDMLLVFSCLENMKLREKLFLRVKSKGYALRNYISPKAVCPSNVKMGENNIIMALVHIGVGGIMGNNNLIRQGVYLGHDFVLKDHTAIAPGCSIGGRCIIEDFAYVGLGAIINNNIRVHQESIVGSGAVVIKDIEKFSVNVGNPSHIIRYNDKNA